MRYRPTALEARCLEQLDRTENWAMLNRDQPAAEEHLDWRPFGRIFVFNLGVFGVVFVVLVSALALASGSSAGSDLPWLVLAVLAGAAGMAGLTSWLYRRSWNRRAKAYREE